LLTYGTVFQFQRVSAPSLNVSKGKTGHNTWDNCQFSPEPRRHLTAKKTNEQPTAKRSFWPNLKLEEQEQEDDDDDDDDIAIGSRPRLISTTKFKFST